LFPELPSFPTRRSSDLFVFQSYNLIPVLTALENVEFIMLLQKKDKKERQDRAITLLESVGLADKIHKRPNELSGGQTDAFQQGKDRKSTRLNSSHVKIS